MSVGQVYLQRASGSAIDAFVCLRLGELRGCLVSCMCACGAAGSLEPCCRFVSAGDLAVLAPRSRGRASWAAYESVSTRVSVSCVPVLTQ